ncbi:MAG: phosphoglucomutase/phosphomannomutase family protein [Candidatus Omnitrophica bacterium]|nr:phosphoglucomutase/phosphomannomutase family protein [Candidatus Omnitrophota bacterium]
MNIKFGTDGWRAVIGEDFTFENIKIVSQAIAEYIKKQWVKGRTQGAVVGYDTRFMGKEFADVVVTVLAGNGIKVFLSKEPTSTPALSLSVKQNKLIGGIMITASHNPPRYSGLKYKGAYAGPADPEDIREIESFLGKGRIVETSKEEAKKAGLLKEVDLNKPHFEFLKSYVNMALLKNAKFKILVDVMYGAGDHLIQNILKDSKCEVKTIHAELNPAFGGTPPEPIECNLTELIGMVKGEGYDIGLATDGDADRIGVISCGGEFITSSQVIALLLVHFVEDKKWTGSVVKTISGSFLIDEIAKGYKLKLHETAVGFKYICRLMQTEDVLLGGEESGGIGFKKYVPERDGTLAGLLLLEMMAYRKKSITQILRDIEKRFGKFVQKRLDLRCPEEKKTALFAFIKERPPTNLLGTKIVQTITYDGVKFIAADKSWILFRSSGTEPILRIYCEADSAGKVKKLLELGKAMVLNV